MASTRDCSNRAQVLDGSPCPRGTRSGVGAIPGEDASNRGNLVVDRPPERNPCRVTRQPALSERATCLQRQRVVCVAGGLGVCALPRYHLRAPSHFVHGPRHACVLARCTRCRSSSSRPPPTPHLCLPPLHPSPSSPPVAPRPRLPAPPPVPSPWASVRS